MNTYISLSDILLNCSIDTGGLPDILLEGISWDIGWEDFVAGSRREGLSETIYHYQHEAFGNGLVPDFVTDALRQDYTLTNESNERSLRFLKDTATSLNKIDMIVFKVAGLMNHVYPNKGLRRFHDIDILVRKKQLVDVEERLTEMGLRRKGDDGSNQDSNNKLNENRGLVYSSEKGGPSIHIHWTLVNEELQEHQGITIDTEAIWDKAIQVENNIYRLCPEHQIIHLSENAVRHSFQRLSEMRDLHEIMRLYKNEIDYEYLTQCAHNWGLAKSVFFCLAFLKKKLGTGIKDSLLESLQKPAPGWFGNLFLRRLLNDKRSPELCSMAWLDMQSSLSEKRQLLKRVAFLPQHSLARIYHTTEDSITPWFYLKRFLYGLYNGLVAATLALVRRQSF